MRLFGFGDQDLCVFNHLIIFQVMFGREIKQVWVESITSKGHLPEIPMEDVEDWLTRVP